MGAGKGTVAEYLVDKKGFTHLSVREFLNKEIVRRGLPINRDNMVKVGNNLREKYGPSYLAESLYEIARKSAKDCIIESLRAPREIEALRAKGSFYLFAVDAKPKIRYERILLRQGETDRVSFEEFARNEKREMESKDPNKQNLGKCILLADFKFDNNGTVEDLYRKVDKALDEIEKG